MQIAVDGPAGAGKSTIAKKIAQVYGILYLDTGAMYRSIANEVLVQGVSFQNTKEIVALTEKAKITFLDHRVFCNKKEVTEDIRTALVTKHTAEISSIKEVRALLVKQQREIASNQSVIMDGRDIGSVVLPEAEFKFFLDADVRERALRRKKELDEKGVYRSLETIKEEITKRDDKDRSRIEGPLIQVPEAIVIDTTGKSIDEVCQCIKKEIEKRFFNDL